MILARWTAPQRRTGGGDKLEIEPDGAFRLERFSGIARVGYFAGTLTDAELAELNAAIETARHEDVAEPGQPVADGGESVVTGAGFYTPSRNLSDQPAQRALLILLRRLAMDLTRSPVAAVDLELIVADRTLLVRHIGSEPLHLEKAALSLVPGTGDAQAVQTSTGGRIPSEGTAADGDWTEHIALGPDATGDFQVYADFVLVGAESSRAAQVTVNNYAD